jgi:hypothetical protein
MADKPEAKTPAPSPADKAAAAGSSRKKRIVTGAAIGIGSAALVAALLYANRARRTDKS